MSVVFPITQTRYFQLNDRGYYTLISVYNLTVALLGTVLFFSALAKEHNLKIKRRKLAIAILALVPSWFTIMATIPIQLFAVERAAKVWQSNLIVILVLVCIYIYLVFKEGFMGIRLRHETYKWDQDGKAGRADPADDTPYAEKIRYQKSTGALKTYPNFPLKKCLTAYTDIIMRSTQRISDFLHVDTEQTAELKCTPSRDQRGRAA